MLVVRRVAHAGGLLGCCLKMQLCDWAWGRRAYCVCMSALYCPAIEYGWLHALNFLLTSVRTRSPRHGLVPATCITAS
jgi:hypothetical protein